MTKILLVEDDRSLREIYGVRLLAEGYDIVSAGDGEEALAMAVAEHPDLVISDVMMPRVSGFDMLDILRANPSTRDVKVIMMTALSSEEQRKRGEMLGADKYLVKSQVGIEDVVKTVHEVLGDANLTPEERISKKKPQAPAMDSNAAPVMQTVNVETGQVSQPAPAPQNFEAPAVNSDFLNQPQMMSAPQPVQPAPQMASQPAQMNPAPVRAEAPMQVQAPVQPVAPVLNDVSAPRMAAPISPTPAQRPMPVQPEQQRVAPVFADVQRPEITAQMVSPVSVDSSANIEEVKDNSNANTFGGERVVQPVAKTLDTALKEEQLAADLDNILKDLGVTNSNPESPFGGL